MRKTEGGLQATGMLAANCFRTCWWPRKPPSPPRPPVPQKNCGFPEAGANVAQCMQHSQLFFKKFGFFGVPGNLSRPAADFGVLQACARAGVAMYRLGYETRSRMEVCPGL